MPTYLVTGAHGFIAKHVVAALSRLADATVLTTDRETTEKCWDDYLSRSDVVFHLAGTNRPPREEDFVAGNADLTARICDSLRTANRRPLLVLASSIQAAHDNPYGRSKKKAEEIAENWARSERAPLAIFRLKNVFGKWCRPNYNSVTATFCHNIARGIPIKISDPARELSLVYIDDVIEGLLAAAGIPDGSRALPPGIHRPEIQQCFNVTLGELAEKIRSFKSSRENFISPSFADPFSPRIYATYLSHLEVDDFGYQLIQHEDPRGSLAEFIKQPHLGQMFVSRTVPGVTRGNHYHDTKTEKFMVVHGEGIIRFRQIHGNDVIQYPVKGTDYRVVDIPPGYTHSIENVGNSVMVTLFWACEVFDPAQPDTFFLPVIEPESPSP